MHNQKTNERPLAQLQFAAMVEFSNDAIITSSLDGTITSWNQAAEHVLGYSKQEVIDQQIEMLVPLDLENRKQKVLTQIKRGERINCFRTKWIRKDEKSIDILVSISPLTDNSRKIIGTYNIVREITDYPTNEAESKLSNYLQAIGKLALISVTNLKGEILEVNPKFCEISGYKKEELIGQDHRILNSGVHPSSFWAEMWVRVVKGGIWRQEVCNRHKDGYLYWVDSVVVPLRDHQGMIDGYLSVRVDVTQRKEQEAALRERLKERACLYAIRRNMLPQSSIDEVCQNILTLLKEAMQFPEITVVRIELDSKEFVTANYTHSLEHVLSAEIIANDNSESINNTGQLQVFYLEDRPFLLPEEQKLIDSVADDLGLWFGRRKAELHISHLATHDALTGLPNRYLLQDRIEQVLVQSDRDHERAAVLFIDLDHFKTTNDSLGHQIGDLLLKEIATRLTSCVRSEDTVARQGGDEFITVLKSITSISDASIVAQKILDALISPYSINGKELHMGASIGITIYPDDGKDTETLLKNSDIALYHAKEQGRNNYQFFTLKMNQLVTERHSLGIDLRNALGRNELQLYFQPVVGITDGMIKSMEVLLRWRHPVLGLIPPVKFISLAEEIGMIVPIGEWVFRSVCLQIISWLKQGYEVPQLAINFSARQLQCETLAIDIKSILNEIGLGAHYLALEITESKLAQNIDETIEILNQLSSIGLAISMDDFGTGYSSLSNLKRYPVNTLKIDRSFVRDIATDPNDAAIITAIIAMARSLEMEVVAEGVETEEQLNFLIQQGCDYYQGYYFCRPLPATEIKDKLQHVTNG